MARKLRVQYAGAIYHVMNRGDRREPIFKDDADRKRFLETLGEACQKAGWRLHAWCLMSNRFHLVIETPQANLVAGMKWFLGTYTNISQSDMEAHLLQSDPLTLCFSATRHPRALPTSWRCPGQHRGAVLRGCFTSARLDRSRSGMRPFQRCLPFLPELNCKSQDWPFGANSEEPRSSSR
jgi:REP element-mobilizing transposase RayT